ncbi:hypothetical protein CQW23_29733 [Capsicum baccatum]|uniref:SPARK domain-containing protein n=1 Tax=Capsicum baccatum TaxID=33114 RepID=A0A2G2VCF3_CAPBA|nr:hypothetical protein CQW23_29733 [Capsicum baccatum]
MCSVKSSNLTGESCPVKDISTFEKAVNTSKLLESCSTVDPLKECCRPVCQPAISEAALQISGIKTTLSDNKNIVGAPSEIDTLNDCKGVVYSWITRKLRFEDANTAFRLLSSCKVNKGGDQFDVEKTTNSLTELLIDEPQLEGVVFDKEFEDLEEVEEDAEE